MDIRSEVKTVLDRHAGPYQQDLLEHVSTLVSKLVGEARAEKVKSLSPKPGDVLVFTGNVEPSEYDIATLRRAVQSSTGIAPGKLAILWLPEDADLDFLTADQRRMLARIVGVNDVLEAALHDLVTVNGLTATDKPTAKMGKFSFVVNVMPTIEKLQALLPEGEAQPSEAQPS